MGNLKFEKSLTFALNRLTPCHQLNIPVRRGRLWYYQEFCTNFRTPWKNILEILMNMINDNKDLSWEYVNKICHLYDDIYDDREEDSKPKGLNWEPGLKAAHKSIAAFQMELEEVHGMHLSRTKIQKILISGGCWTTERSREIQWLYDEYTAPVEKNGKGMNSKEAIQEIAKHLEISTVSVNINLPYGKVVYDLEKKSPNAVRIDRCRVRKKRK